MKNEGQLQRDRPKNRTRKSHPSSSVIEQIHQQLDTKRKLFCGCPPILHKEEPEFTISRQLRPTTSELGEIDSAAIFEFQKGKTIVYEGYNDTTCLVEVDSAS